jgi:hypothetical protein
MNEVCKAKMTEDSLQDLHWRVRWIAGREFYRTAAKAEQMKAWDALAAGAYPDHNFNDGNAELNDFVGKLNFPKWMPGWNDANCTFSQKEFACFIHHVTHLPVAESTEMLEQITGSDAPIDFSCVTLVEEDPIYVTNFGSPAAKKSSIWPWLVGLAGLGVVGAVIASRKGGAGKNPAGPPPNNYQLAEQAHLCAAKAFKAGERHGGAGNSTVYPGKWYAYIETHFGRALSASELVLFNREYDEQMHLLTYGPRGQRSKATRSRTKKNPIRRPWGPVPEPGYAYATNAAESSADDNWDTEIIGPEDGPFVYRGQRTIDGARVDVWKAKDAGSRFRYVAQTARGR